MIALLFKWTRLWFVIFVVVALGLYLLAEHKALFQLLNAPSGTAAIKGLASMMGDAGAALLGGIMSLGQKLVDTVAAWF
jgi:hypothetical protein